MLISFDERCLLGDCIGPRLTVCGAAADIFCYLPRSDTVGASGSTVSTRHGLLTLADRCELSGSVGLDAGEIGVAVTAFRDRSTLGNVVVAELATWCLDLHSSGRLGVVRVARSEGDTFSHFDDRM